MSTNRTADQAFVRKVNLSLVLRHIFDEAPISRAKIAAMTGLNKSTVSSLVDDLLRRGLIRENGVNSTGTGRPATLLEINPEAGCIIGVQFGVDFVAVALTDFFGKILWKRRLNTEPAETQDDTLAQTLELVKEAADACQIERGQLLGLGLSVPGTVNIEHGALIFAPNLQWQNVPLREIFSEHSGLNVFVENDANAAAIAEHLFGVARQIKDFIFVFVGVGLGGGLFLNGKLYRGNNGFAGEIGHTPIAADFPPINCHCGNRGCWETFANQASILMRVQSRLEANQDSIIHKLVTEQQDSLSISIVKQAAEMGCEEAILALTDTGTALGQGFVGLINTFNPEKIILGGTISILGEYLLPAIKEYIDQHSLNKIGGQVQVLLSSFNADASLIGGIAIVVDDILSNPMQVNRRW